jgi:hypothetical protein
MTLTDGKEAYGMFLQSDWWKRLSLECRERRRFVCERCGVKAGRNKTQAHHKRYPEHWFDTKLEDLECVCRGCHEKEHGIGVTISRKVTVKTTVTVTEVKVEEWTLKSLSRARSQHLIGREKYLEVRRVLEMEKGQRAKGRMKRSKQKAPRLTKQQLKERTRAKMESRKLRRYPLKERRWWPGIYEGTPRGGKPPGVR